MQVIEFGQQLNCPIVLCLGYFGTMHSGHVKLLDVAKQRAHECKAKVALFTFSNNHLQVLGKDSTVVYTYAERLELYKNLGVEVVIAAEFNNKFRACSGDKFVEQLAGYNLKGIVCGFDYTYGCDHKNSQSLKVYFSDVCNVDIVDAVCWNNVKVSTTLARDLLLKSDVNTLNTILSEPYFVIGTVVHGRHVGSEMGFPTANLQVSCDKLLPIGVYGGVTVVDGKSYKAIVNVGQKPTFGLDYVNIEAHILDFDGDLYGKTLKVSLTRFLRSIRKYKDSDELVEQLKQDRETVLND
ncbi:MAG: riboflavin biosynthesis protein RibF [Clostridiales bacterium]|nr:riboflavin biosynthesis protein RibF [Clostridiales bacterium]